MATTQKLKHELKSLAFAGLYFAVWIAALLVLKDLLLAEYQIAFHGWSMALVGALVLSKVVLLLERVSFGSWVRAQPAWVDVVLRTALYSLGVAVVMVLEKAFEGRHERGGFIAALTGGVRDADVPHVLTNTLCLSGALFCYNVLMVLRLRLGEGGVLRFLLLPLPEARPAAQPQDGTRPTHPPHP